MPAVTHQSEEDFSFRSDVFYTSVPGSPYPDPVQTTNQSVGTAINSKTGINNPQYRQQIRAGQNASTEFSGHKTSYVPNQAEMTYYQPNGFGPGLLARWDFKGTFVVGHNVITEHAKDSSTVEQEALIQLYRRVKAQHQKFSGLTFLGELGQAVKMIKRPAESLFRGVESYLDALRKRSKGVSKTTKTGRSRRKKILADTWLEYSFGWAPLVSDVKSAAQALAAWKVSRDGFDERRYRISSSKQSLFPGISLTDVVPINVHPGLSMPFDMHVKGSWDCTVRYLVGLSYKTSVPSGSAAHLAELAGFKFSEFIPTAWELLPWSFLIDYFSSVGDVLSAFSTPTNNITWIQRTVRYTDYKTVGFSLGNVWRSIPGSVTIETNGFTSYWSGKRSSFVRTPLTGLDLPRFELVNPFGKSALSRAVNMTALAAGARSIKPFY